MSLYDVEIFLLVFFVCYLLLACIMKIIHIIRKDNSKDYRIAIIIFSLLVAAMVTYTQLGRHTPGYPRLQTTITQEQTT